MTSLGGRQVQRLDARQTAVVVDMVWDVCRDRGKVKGLGLVLGVGGRGKALLFAFLLHDLFVRVR